MRCFTDGAPAWLTIVIAWYALAHAIVRVTGFILNIDTNDVALELPRPPSRGGTWTKGATILDAADCVSTAAQAPVHRALAAYTLVNITHGLPPPRIARGGSLARSMLRALATISAAQSCQQPVASRAAAATSPSTSHG